MNNVNCPQCGFVNSASAACVCCRMGLRQNSPARMPVASAAAVPNPSIFQILKNDYLSFLGACVPLVFWALFIGIMVFGLPEKNGRKPTETETRVFSMIFLTLSILATGIIPALLRSRVNSFRRIFAAGRAVVGIINFVDFEKDRGRVEYSYNFEQKAFQSGAAIMKNSKTKHFRTGDELVLLVDPENPKRALIRDLYL